MTSALNRANWASVAQFMVNLSRTIQTKTVSDTAKRNKKMAEFKLESGETLNMTTVEDGPNIMYWARNWHLDIGAKSYGF